MISWNSQVEGQFGWPEGIEDSWPDRWRYTPARLVLRRFMKVRSGSEERFARLTEAFRKSRVDMYPGLGISVLNENDTRAIGTAVLRNAAKRAEILDLALPKKKVIDCTVVGLTQANKTSNDSPTKLLRAVLDPVSRLEVRLDHSNILSNLGFSGKSSMQYLNIAEADEAITVPLMDQVHDPEAGFFPLRATLLVPQWYDLETHKVLE
jgi:hypothetical protein